jgi:putative transposase
VNQLRLKAFSDGVLAIIITIRRVGISEQTSYRRKKQYPGKQSDQVRELEQLQDGNARLEKLVAELSLDKAILRDVAARDWRGPRWRGMQSDA